MYLRVKLRNSQTPANGTFLTAEGRNYQAKLARQENNFITLYIKQGSKTVLETTYAVRYVAEMADREHPSVGDTPPIVTTNLDGFTGEITNRNFTFLVKARTHEGKIIYSDNIQVTLDGAPVSNPTGSDVFEYQLYFENPLVGDTEEHRITVLAWDDEGNSTYLEYHVTYAFIDTGGAIGTAYILLDATTVGLDPTLWAARSPTRLSRMSRPPMRFLPCWRNLDTEWNTPGRQTTAFISAGFPGRHDGLWGDSGESMAKDSGR